MLRYGRANEQVRASPSKSEQGIGRIDEPRGVRKDDRGLGDGQSLSLNFDRRVRQINDPILVSLTRSLLGNDIHTCRYDSSLGSSRRLAGTIHHDGKQLRS
jgi:hypothetical protein